MRQKNRVIRISSLHFNYASDLIRHFDFYFSAVEPVTEDYYCMVDYSKPSDHTLSNSKMVFYFPSFAESEDSLDIYLKKAALKKGDIVFDFGAYCGVATYFFAKAVGDEGRVYAFEPDLQNYEALIRNIKRYSLNNVVPINKGVWSYTTELPFQAEGNLGSSIVSVLKRNDKVKKTEMISMEDAFREAAGGTVSFVKIDIEGAEIEVLKSSKELLRKIKPRLIVEPHFVNGKIATREVQAVLEDIGFKCEIIKQGDFHLPLIYAIYAMPNARIE